MTEQNEYSVTICETNLCKSENQFEKDNNKPTINENNTSDSDDENDTIENDFQQSVLEEVIKFAHGENAEIDKNQGNIRARLLAFMQEDLRESKMEKPKKVMFTAVSGL